MRLLGLSPLFALLISSCQSPCESLAERICSCEANSVEEAGCLQEVKSAMDRVSPNMAEEEACESLLDACDCAALEREDFAACGLSRGG